MLIFGIGFVWVILQASTMDPGDIFVVPDRATMAYGLLAAIFVTVSNILLLECMTHLPISLASTVYRLNTIPLVLLAFLLLDESLSLLRMSGILAGVATVFLLYQPDRSSPEHGRRYSLFLGLIIVASIIRALYGVATKAGINEGANPDVMMLFAAIGWCIGGLAYAYFREHRVVLTRDKLAFIPIAGGLVFAIVWLLTTALTLGDASVVVPIANMGFIAAFLFSVALKLEHMNLRKLLAVAMAALAVVLLTKAA